MRPFYLSFDSGGRTFSNRCGFSEKFIQRQSQVCLKPGNNKNEDYWELNMSKIIPWSDNVLDGELQTLSKEGRIIVSPTKVGYVVVARDKFGLEKKFEAKQRSRNKPAVVLCASLEQLETLAVLNEESRRLYQMHWEQDILLGCILPWRNEAILAYLEEDLVPFVTDPRRTSCFVIRFGAPTEALASDVWRQRGLLFASSANLSGKGNNGVLKGVGDRILDHADLVVEADEYVSSMQPDKTVADRYEQGVMVSLVDETGTHVPVQAGQRSVLPAPTLIRKGLDMDRIMMNLSAIYPSWNYRHGEYY
jgi:tRNA A37 threonylcarbamoyladenosine synthetase subunit TsaC/SUA5/YrdC